MAKPEDLDIALENCSAYHEWTKIGNALALEFADALEAGGKDLKKGLRKTPVAHPGYVGKPGSVYAARQVTSGIFKAVEHLRAVPILLGKAFYTYNGLFVPVRVLKGGGAHDPSK
jgi:hypothetical protein